MECGKLNKNSLKTSVLLCCFFVKELKAKKSTKWKKKNVPPFLRGIGVTVDEIEIPCFRKTSGSGKRRFFQIFVFWAGLESAFWCRNFKPSNTKWNILSSENFAFLLTCLNVWTNQGMLLKYELLKHTGLYSKRLPR